MDMQPWTILSQKTLLDRKWLRITEDSVKLPNGTVIDEFHVMHSPHWAAAIALTDAGQVVMVEQYRHGLGRASLELPSGVIDPDERPLEAAKRELFEETGHRAREWLHLLEVSPEPSRSTHRAHFYVARGAVQVGEARPEASEVINLRLLDVESLINEVMSGRIDHAAHVGAILLAERRGLLRLASP